MMLLTRDVNRYRTYFPSLELYSSRILIDISMFSGAIMSKDVL
ncbi:MAG: hypothetical protein ACK5OU_20850 [Dolichospermum sp.]